jgi:hypothetical protein
MINKDTQRSNNMRKTSSFWGDTTGAPEAPMAVTMGLFPQDVQVATVPMITATAGGGQQEVMQRVAAPVLVGRIPTTSGACASCEDSLKEGGLKGLCGFVDANGRYGRHTWVKCQPPNYVFGCYYDSYQDCGSVLQGAQTAAYSSAPYHTALANSFDQSDYGSAIQTFFASLNKA